MQRREVVDLGKKRTEAFQEMPENSMKPVGFEWHRLPVEFFIKMFWEDNWQLLVKQSNIYRHRLHLHAIFMTWMGGY